MKNPQQYDSRDLNEMPFDKMFHLDDGMSELCHATGKEVFIDGEWWNEYLDHNGEYHYGR